MIDLTNEQLVAVADVPRLVPSAQSGKRLHVATAYRWITKGVRGIRLEAVRLGGTWLTSREALQRFSAKLTDGKVPPPEETTPGRDARQADSVERELDALGL